MSRIPKVLISFKPLSEVVIVKYLPDQGRERKQTVYGLIYSVTPLNVVRVGHNFFFQASSVSVELSWLLV